MAAAGKKGEKTLYFGARLKYPIKITRLYKMPGDQIRRREPVLQYAFEYTMELPQDRATLALQTKTLTSITDWNAPEDGMLLAWDVHLGELITGDSPCMTVEESCTHEIQFQGLCALCGKDMNEVNWASEERDTDRAPINMTHDQTNLTVSHSAATEVENQLQSRLLAQRKLSLVVDLDQTIIHACFDPTIGEWQQDPDNPNYAALRDVRRFQLDNGGGGGTNGTVPPDSSAAAAAAAGNRGNWYYIKMRPGLADFLATIATMYELHVYTMGTRSYATNIARIVDPDQRLFSNRVISRDENGNIVAKSLQRLFPVSTHMAVIIDDRADVWPFNRHNLIKVTPYDFFKGTGDINSSFLPKRSDLVIASSSSPAPASIAAASPAATAAADVPASGPTVVADDREAVASTVPTAAVATVSSTEPTPGVADGSNKPSDKPGTKTATPSPAAPSDDLSEEELATLKRQAEEQERAIELQIKERPLLHMQQKLDQEDQEAAKASTAVEAEAASSMAVQRHCVLSDDDTELAYLQAHLTKLHRVFYEDYDARRSKSPYNVPIPDVSTLLDRMKGEVLKNTVIVLSGLVPLGLGAQYSEIGLQTISFGANLQHHISKTVTHLVISSDRPRTQKVRQAARFPGIKIVNQDWLASCFTQWAHVDEGPYLVDIHPADRGKPQTDDASDTETISGAESEDGGGQEGLGERQDEDDEFKDFNNSDSMSPIAELGTFDWGSADDELAMFLAEGDDDDEDDDENGNDDKEDGDGDENMVDSHDADGSSSASKRKHDAEDANAEDGRAAPAARGRRVQFAKRQKVGARPAASSRSSSQTRIPPVAVAKAASVANGLSEPASARTATATAVPASVDIDEDQLEAMLMAELGEEEEAAEEAEAEGAGSGKEGG